MPTEVIMPKVDMDMTSGRIVAWHVEAGGAVEAGQPLFDIETDKAAMEVESPATGALHHPADIGESVGIGEPVAWIYGPDETIGEAPRAAPHEAIEQPPPAPLPAPAPALQAAPPATSKPRATPYARRLARDAGIELAAVRGSAKAGRITRGDIEALLDSPPSLSVASEEGGLAVHRAGRGDGTPLVLIHGLAADSMGWARLEALLAADRPVIKIDLPCHGRSPLRVPGDFRALVSELRLCLDGLDLAGAHLIGHSLGGAVALALADTRARDLRSLTLISPAGLGPEIDGGIIAGLLRANCPASLGPWLRQLVDDPERITPAYVRLAMAARADAGQRAAQTAMAERLFPDGTQAMDLHAALHRLTLPTRILFGRRDRVIPWRHALRAPGRVSLNLFDRVGHLPQLECPEEVAALLATLSD